MPPFLVQFGIEFDVVGDLYPKAAPLKIGDFWLGTFIPEGLE